MITRLAAAALLALATAAPAAPMQLAQGESEPPAESSLDQAVREAERRTDGDVLSAETVTTEDGERVHRLRVLIDAGRVRVIEIPARSTE